MNYFITGGTGFIGRHLIAELLEKKPRAKIYVLVRLDSKKKFNQQKIHWGDGARRVTAITGDLTRPLLGVPAKKRRELEGEISQVFHLGAVYDLMAEAEHQVRVNMDGTRNAIRFAANIKARRFNHVSSIAAAGLYAGIFREDMFEEARGWRTPISAPSTTRKGWSGKSARSRGASTGRASSSGTRKPASSTRSTGLTTSSS